MKTGNIVFIIDAFLPYVRNEIGDGLAEEDWFFNSISYTYIPLIKMCENLKKDGIDFKFGIVFEPVLCDMLNDPFLQEKYSVHLEKKIAFAKKELERFSISEKPGEFIKYNLELFNEHKEIFNSCGKNILKKFNSLSEEGFIEILATTATRCFLPFLEQVPEAIAAQIEMGQISFREYFSSIPSGFWLPALGYSGCLDKIIRSYGFDYTVLDSKGFLLADKVPAAGVFSAAGSDTGLKFLAADECAYQMVYKSTKDFAANPVYIDCENDLGFKLSEDYLSAVFDTSKGRRAIGFRYWSKDKNETYYDMEKAKEQIKLDAAAFVDYQERNLNTVKSKTECSSPVSVFVCSSDFFGKKWCEGIAWLNQVFRIMHGKSSLKSLLPIKACNIEKELFNIKPFFSSMFDSGYAGELITGKNNWMYHYVLKITKRMIELTEMFPKDSAVKESVLNAAAREVFLLQSYYWPLYYAEGYFEEFAEKRFIEHVKAFSFAYDELGANNPPTKWLAKRWKKYPILKDVNYMFFSRKK